MRQRSDYPTFADAEIDQRHQSVYGLMEQEGVDALLVYGSGRYASDIYWLSDWPSSREAYLLMQTGRRSSTTWQRSTAGPVPIRPAASST